MSEKDAREHLSKTYLKGFRTEMVDDNPFDAAITYDIEARVTNECVNTCLL